MCSDCMHMIRFFTLVCLLCVLAAPASSGYDSPFAVKEPSPDIPILRGHTEFNQTARHILRAQRFRLSSDASPAVLREHTCLVDLYEHMGGAEWTVEWDIERDDHCLWDGVECDVHTRRITTLHLEGFGLRGPLRSCVGVFTDVVIIRLGENDITALPDAVDQWTKMERFAADANVITEIPQAVRAWVSVVAVDLHNNFLSRIPCATAAWVNVEAVDLSRNQITVIPDCVSAWTRLQAALLYQNEIWAIPPAVGAWRELRSFYAGWNNLKTLPASVGNWTLLEDIDVRTQPFRSMPCPGADGWTHLHSLYISDTEIQTLPSCVGAWRRLTRFIGARSSLTSFPKEVGNWTRMVSFFMTEHRLTQPLPDSVGQWGALQNFVLNAMESATPLTSLPATAANWHNLSAIDIRYNQLSALPPGLRWPELTSINLLANRFTELPAALAHCQQLQQVGCGRNPISTIPNFVAGWSQLRFLSVVYANLTQLPSPGLSTLSKLSGLLLSGNKLRRVVAREHLPPSLRVLHLNNNQMHDLNLTGCDSLTDLDLSQNAFEVNSTLALGDPEEITSLNIGAMSRDNTIHPKLPTTFHNLASLFIDETTVVFTGDNFVLGELLYAPLLRSLSAERLHINADSISGSTFYICSLLAQLFADLYLLRNVNLMDTTFLSKCDFTGYVNPQERSSTEFDEKQLTCPSYVTQAAQARVVVSWYFNYGRGCRCPVGMFWRNDAISSDVKGVLGECKPCPASVDCDRSVYLPIELDSRINHTIPDNFYPSSPRGHSHALATRGQLPEAVILRCLELDVCAFDNQDGFYCRYGRDANSLMCYQCEENSFKVGKSCVKCWAPAGLSVAITLISSLVVFCMVVFVLWKAASSQDKSASAFLSIVVFWLQLTSVIISFQLGSTRARTDDDDDNDRSEWIIQTMYILSSIAIVHPAGIDCAPFWDDSWQFGTMFALPLLIIAFALVGFLVDRTCCRGDMRGAFESPRLIDAGADEKGDHEIATNSSQDGRGYVPPSDPNMVKMTTLTGTRVSINDTRPMNTFPTITHGIALAESQHVKSVRWQFIMCRLLLLVYFPVSTRILANFNCYSTQGHQYVLRHPGTTCPFCSEGSKTLAAFSILGLLLFVIGIPLSVLYVTFRGRWCRLLFQRQLVRSLSGSLKLPPVRESDIGTTASENDTSAATGRDIAPQSSRSDTSLLANHAVSSPMDVGMVWRVQKNSQSHATLGTIMLLSYRRQHGWWYPFTLVRSLVLALLLSLLPPFEYTTLVFLFAGLMITMLLIVAFRPYKQRRDNVLAVVLCLHLSLLLLGSLLNRLGSLERQAANDNDSGTNVSWLVLELLTFLLGLGLAGYCVVKFWRKCSCGG